MFQFCQRRFGRSSTDIRPGDGVMHFRFVFEGPFFSGCVGELPGVREMGVQFYEEVVYDITYDPTCFDHDGMTC
jgi:hypothetical protein